MDLELIGIIDFKGNFEGGFEEEESREFPYIRYYFEGEIKDLTIIKIDGRSPPKNME